MHLIWTNMVGQASLRRLLEALFASRDGSLWVDRALVRRRELSCKSDVDELIKNKASTRLQSIFWAAGCSAWPTRSCGNCVEILEKSSFPSKVAWELSLKGFTRFNDARRIRIIFLIDLAIEQFGYRTAPFHCSKHPKSSVPFSELLNVASDPQNL